MRRWIPILAAAATIATACSPSSGPFPDDTFAVRVSSDVAVGTNRLLVGVTQSDGTRLGSPDDRVSVRIAPIDEPDQAATYPAEFIWIVPDVSGVYSAVVETGTTGTWTVEVLPDDGGSVQPAAFEVFPESLTPAVGSQAIGVETPTSSDSAIESLTTDREPDPSLYEVSLHDAVTSGKATVVIFATPAFCTTAACGPMLEIVKERASSHPDVNFVHVEVYQGFSEPGFVPDTAHLAPAVVAWGLPSEPWVFVVDDEGIVSHKFEGVISSDELDKALS